MSSLKVSKREFGLVSDLVEVRRFGHLKVFRRSDLLIDPQPFLWLLEEDIPGETIQPEKGRFVVRSIDSEIGELVSKRFHYHRTYRRKQRWFMGYRVQHAHGPVQFVRALYAHAAGHNVVEPVMAMQRPAGKLRQESLLLTRQVSGVSLKEYFLNPEMAIEGKLERFRHGLNDLKSMHNDGIAFGDAQTRHQIFDHEGRLWWLDFDKIAIRNVGYSQLDRDLRRFFSSSVLRISQSGFDFEDAFSSMLAVLKDVYPLPSVWEKILIFEVRRRVGRMLKRRGFQRDSDLKGAL